MNFLVSGLPIKLTLFFFILFLYFDGYTTRPTILQNKIMYNKNSKITLLRLQSYVR